jgi:SMC interacting uncharacterized protein involved in chromosome segregation
MSVFDRIFDEIKKAIALGEKVDRQSNDIAELAKEMRRLSERLTRLEAIIELHRPDGTVLRIAKPDESE